MARGIYLGLIALVVPIGFFEPRISFFYLLFLFFLGVGLRPLLEVSGLYAIFSALLVRIDDKKWQKKNEKRRAEVDRRERDRKYRNSRYKDSKLPKNW